MVKARFLKGWSLKLTPMGNVVSRKVLQQRAIDQKQISTNPLTYNNNSQTPSPSLPKTLPNHVQAKKD
jgi:hypothetical protein